MLVDKHTVMARLWQLGGLRSAALQQLQLGADAPLLPTSFAVATAAQTSIGAAALAAECIYHQRSGVHQQVTVDTQAAERECTALFTLDGQTPQTWEAFSGLYACSDGYVRVHANFDHHRDGFLDLLGLGAAPETDRAMAEARVHTWSAQALEDAAAERGLVLSRVRDFATWDRHAHHQATRNEPLLRISRIGEAPPRALPPLDPQQRPLSGLRVLDLTRILAGPICGRTLAAYGADVMLVNAPHLPNIANIIDTSRGKRSALLDLRREPDRAVMHKLLADSHVFVQGYRPGALATLGYPPTTVAALSPGIVCVSLSAYGSHGPWHQRRGFDSLVQTATGFNHAEGLAAGSELPKTLPVPILDYASGFLMAFGAQVARYKQANEGGSWHVEVSLLQTAGWLRSMGRDPKGFGRPAPANLHEHLQPFPCRTGKLQAMPHAAQFSATPAHWSRAASLPGNDAPQWGD